MMDLSSAVQWWDEWQLRILVLGSLGLQWFLLVAAPLRRFAIPSWFRICIWLAYLNSDALAIYALATLFNRHAKATTTTDSGRSGSTASVLEVLWAPILLIHLGGQEEMTAYNIEDNELWRRHAVTVVSQVTVALYVFCKSWPSSGEKRLLAAAILLFIVGVLSFCEKPWALKKASFNSLVIPSALSSLRRGKGGFFSRCFRFCFSEFSELRNSKQSMSLSEQLEIILADLSLSATDSDLKRLQPDNYESVFKDPVVHSELKFWLHLAFRLLYTRFNVVLTPAYLSWHLTLVPFLHIAVIVLFATSHKDGYSGSDVKVTYILFCFTAAVDVLAVFIRELLHSLMEYARVPALCEMVAQYDLKDSVPPKQRPTKLMKCAAIIGCEDYVNKHLYVESKYVYENPDKNIVQLICTYLKPEEGPENARKEVDVASYRRFSSRGSNWVLSEQLRKECGDKIRSSLQQASFDKSVIVWHMATDLCFSSALPPVSPSDEAAEFQRMCIKTISNYMAYLLYFQPEMLMTGSRRYLFTEACNDLELVPVDSYRLPLHDVIMQVELIRQVEEAIGKGSTEGVCVSESRACLIVEASELAQELTGLPNETMWKVIEGVWVGMLCYSASMCRGYLHAKSLGQGGEFLSFVWLLLSLKGVRTLADKLQMPEPAQGVQTADKKLQVPEPDEQAQEEQGMPAAAGASTTSQHQA